MAQFPASNDKSSLIFCPRGGAGSRRKGLRLQKPNVLPVRSTQLGQVHVQPMSIGFLKTYQITAKFDKGGLHVIPSAYISPPPHRSTRRYQALQTQR